VEAGLAKASVLGFADYELDLKNRELRRNGVPIELQPQAFAILSLLASHPNTLVTRIEIQNVVWPTEPASDIHSRLYFQIKSIRQALGDNPNSPAYVQTVPKNGYKFVATVRVLDSSERQPARSGIEDHKNESIRRFSKLEASVAALLLMTGVGFLGFVASPYYPKRRPQASAGQAAVQSSRSDNAAPAISSVTPILPQAIQKIVVSGRNLGNHTAFMNLDTPFLAIRDKTADWAAGRMTPENSDKITLTVESWTDSEIVLLDFSGAYATHGWKLSPGDEIEVAVWNPQTGNGPGLYTLRVSVAGKSAK